MPHDLARAEASTLYQLYRRGRASPVEVTRACLERIDALNARFGVFCRIDGEGALAAARESEARHAAGRPLGRLDGVPATIKDLVLAKGWPTRRGSRTLADAAPDEDDAPATARLREAGCVLLGKTTTPEFGWKAVTDNPLSDIARNPWNPERTPGGSSGGAAVAAALGMGALHVGTDGGGSVRIPSGLTGIVGLKPTFGLVPAWPLSPFGTVSHVGPMTRSVGDAALMLNALALPDRRDWFAGPPNERDFALGLERGVEGLRIAASPDLGFIDVAPEIRRIFEAAIATLAELGAVVETVEPDLSDVRGIFDRHWYVGAANLLDRLTPEKRALVDPGLQEIAEAGAAFPARELREAQLARGALGARLEALFDRHDLLVTPTVALTAFAAGREVPEGSNFERWVDWAGFSYPFNLSQQPALSVPAGLAGDGLPVGLQIVGAKHADALVLRAGRAFEAARPLHLPDPSPNA